MGFGCPSACLEADPLTGTCQSCPPGCSGDDDFNQWTSSCHVNTKAQLALHMVIFVLSIALFLLALGAVLLISSKDHSLWFRFKRWAAKMVKRRALSEAANSHKSVVSSHTLATLPQEGEGRTVRVNIRRQSIFSSWLILWIIVFSLSTALFSSLNYFLSAYRWKRDMPSARLGEFALALSVCSLMACMWTIALKWYDSLPSFRRYGRLFGVNSVLIHHADAFKWWCKIWGVLSVILVMAAFFVVPQVHRVDREMADAVALYLTGAIVIVWLASMCFLIGLLDRVYLKMRMSLEGQLPSPRMSRGSTATEGESRVEALVNEYTRMRTTYWSLLLTSVLGVAIGLVMLIGSVHIQAMRENLYITFSVVAITGELAAGLVLYFVIFRPMLPNLW